MCPAAPVYKAFSGCCARERKKREFLRESPSLLSGICISLLCIMEIESAKCECCGLREDCTREYIAGVKAGFGGRWLCGLCSEAVRDEVAAKKRGDLEGALRDHMSFCAKFGKKDPAFRVADGMRQMLRRRSSDVSAAAASSAAS
ncbi:unnamed protein product [Urochloa decumbens]|uniref:Uncharacterized protein n=1 Tax=Urochloa decumbens TaxID=240449 RepID=A0ABC8XD58_9POAL